MQQMFSNARNHEKTFQKGSETKTCTSQSLYTFFKDHFNPPLPTNTPNEFIDVPDYIKDQQQLDFKIEEDTPTETEIKNVI